MLRCSKAGLNLNVFGALAGAFSSKNSKKTEEDGSTLEEKEENASVSGEYPQARRVRTLLRLIFDDRCWCWKPQRKRSGES